jgi:hypothetical protein
MGPVYLTTPAAASGSMPVTQNTIMPARRNGAATARNVPAVAEFSLYSMTDLIGSAERYRKATMSPLIRRRIFACATVLGFLSLGRTDFSAVEPGPPRSSGAVHALFDLDAPNTGPFPSDWFRVDDLSHITGRRVNLVPTDCSVNISLCEDLEVINTLDGFNLQPRLSIPFDGPIDPRSVTSDTSFSSV